MPLVCLLPSGAFYYSAPDRQSTYCQYELNLPLKIVPGSELHSYLKGPSMIVAIFSLKNFEGIVITTVIISMKRSSAVRTVLYMPVVLSRNRCHLCRSASKETLLTRRVI